MNLLDKNSENLKIIPSVGISFVTQTLSSNNDDIEEVTDATTWASTDLATAINIGSSRSQATPMDGFIQRIRIWDGER